MCYVQWCPFAEHLRLNGLSCMNILKYYYCVLSQLYKRNYGYTALYEKD